MNELIATKKEAFVAVLRITSEGQEWIVDLVETLSSQLASTKLSLAMSGK